MTLCNILWAKVEEIFELQKDLLFIPASRGGWGFNSLTKTKEIAYIAGVASTPYTEQPPPGTPDSRFNIKITAEVQKAIDAIKQIHDLDIVEKTRVNASEFAHGGYTKVQKVLGKAVNEKVNQKFRANKDPYVINWIDAGSSAELPGAQYSLGAASWVTTGPRNPNLTLLDDDFLLAFRARMMLPIALLEPRVPTDPLVPG